MSRVLKLLFICTIKNPKQSKSYGRSERYNAHNVVVFSQ